MANKREFKKYVEAVGASACESMMLTYYNVEGVDKDAIAKSIETVLGAVGNATANANVYFDKGHKAFDSLADYSKAKKAFFRQLFDKIDDDFTKALYEAIKQFNAAIPASVKEQNKAAAAN